MRNVLAALLQVLGMLTATAAAWIVYYPAGMVALGAVLFLVGLDVERSS